MSCRFGISLLLMYAAVMPFVLAGCSKSAKSFAPVIDPDAAAKAALDAYDADQNGAISGPELDKAASLKSNLKLIDANNDSAITADEIAARIRLWQTDKMMSSRTLIHCKVYRNKQAVPDANIRLVPEKFLGDSLPAVVGRTGANGAAVLQVENSAPDDSPGVGPGFYRVEITKSGEPIPAKYNTETTLGLDTSMDNPAVGKGVRFDID